MADSTYSFLRFHVAGMGFMIYSLVLVSPFVSTQGISLLFADTNRLVAFVGLVVFLALPIGYLIHQAVVNRYRSVRKWRPAHTRLEAMLKQFRPEFLPPANAPLAERFIILDSVLAFTLSVSTGNSAPRTVAESAAVKLDERWSHFYARLALSIYSSLLAAVLTLAVLAFAALGAALPQVAIFSFAQQIITLSPATFLVELLIAMPIAAVVSVVGSYRGKLWAELCIIELLLLDRKREEIIEFLRNIQEAPWIGLQIRTVARARRWKLRLPRPRP